MRTWSILLAGPVLWTAHFFALYIIASLLPGSRAATLLVVAATVVAGGLALWLIRKAAGALRSDQERLDSWIYRLSLLASAVSLVAIVYQGMPALIG